MTSPTISVATPADAERVAALAAVTFALACPPGTAAEAIEQFIAQNLSAARFEEYLADAGRCVLLADVGGEASGYTMLVFADPHADIDSVLSLRPTVELSKVYVHARHHGAGIAAPLMSETLAAATERGAAGVWLGVNKQNAKAIRFYEKSGFAVVGSKTFQLGPELHDDHVMERALVH
ncbi:GNAT family N-acetyltransferase [Compostimonas suwonensis]|uniref:Ribosomal protein S18 acetylase RimI-like enzyme n=1 Tax=Compostimonas suwonensis TaxID=1048394 RepID=A0A2M9BCU8_9MICO|nr:GNAT family N-acetyltransferase [Compostimonas suwonensis]PJJ55752.1 ribosomal protein S18 acetylase RimI-like enzyme [Compostimonas suwonensis]